MSYVYKSLIDTYLDSRKCRALHTNSSEMAVFDPSCAQERPESNAGHRSCTIL